MKRNTSPGSGVQTFPLTLHQRTTKKRMKLPLPLITFPRLKDMSPQQPVRAMNKCFIMGYGP